jgi:phosphate:Na+ symporter
LFVLLGFVVTGIIQSSFAMIAILLSALNAHAIPMEHAAAAVVGSELGTAIKLVFGSVSGSADKRRFAWGNFVFNVLSLSLGMVFLFPLVHLISHYLFPGNPLMALVSFQSILNLIVVILSYPFLRQFAEWLESTIRPEHQEPTETASSGLELYSDDRLRLLREGTLNLFYRVIRLNRKALGITAEGSVQKRSMFQRLTELSRAVPFIDEYRQLKQEQGELLESCADLLREELSPDESERLNRLVVVLRNCVHAAKNLKDIRHNLKELSDSANDRLFGLLTQLREREAAFYKGLEAEVKAADKELGRRLEENKDELERLTAHALTLLQEHAIKEYEASTLMNVYREVYSSHKALLKVRVEAMGN